MDDLWRMNFVGGDVIFSLILLSTILTIAFKAVSKSADFYNYY